LPCRSDFPSILGGFPHSEIVGSKGIRTSPTLIAAYHVLHRLCMPRHPPIALKTLDCSHCQCPSGTEPRNEIGNKKDQLLEICSMARLGKPIICARLSVLRDEPSLIITRPIKGVYGTPKAEFRRRNPNKSSLYDVIQNRHRTKVLCKLVFLRTTRPSTQHHLVEPDGIEPTTPCLQSRCSPS
jgi:hypothetical protein